MRVPFIWLAAFSIACPVSASNAEEVVFPDLGEPVPGHDGVTYLDLARMVVPDLAPDEVGGHSGSAPVPMRHVSGTDAGDPPQRSAIPFVGALQVRSGGKARLLLMLDLNAAEGQAEGYAALALYDLTGGPKLLDVANVAADRETYFRNPAVVAAGTADDAVATMSMHANSSQAYVTTELILVRHDRLEPIDTIYTFGDQGCGWRHDQEPVFETGPGSPFADIVARVEDTMALTGETCGEAPPRPSSRVFTVTYRWDGSRYRADSDAFARLAEENEKRF